MYVYINIYIIVKGLPANNQSMRMQASQHLVKVDLAGRLLESVDVDLPWPEVRFNPYVIRCLTGPMMHFAQCLLFFLIDLCCSTLLNSIVLLFLETGHSLQPRWPLSCLTYRGLREKAQRRGRLHCKCLLMQIKPRQLIVRKGHRE